MNNNGRSDADSDSDSAPPTDSEDDAHTTNHEACIKLIQSSGCEASVVMLSPDMFGYPNTRLRGFYPIFKLSRLESLIQQKNLILPQGTSTKGYCQHLFAKIERTVHSLMATRTGTKHTLSEFLVADDDPDIDKGYEHMLAAGGRTLSQRVGAPKWHEQHHAIFESKSLKFNPNVCDPAYHDSRFYDLLPARCRSMLSYHDQVNPLIANDDEEETLDLNLR